MAVPKTMQPGDVFSLGTWGETPLEWKVLEVSNAGALLLSVDAVDCVKYNPSMRNGDDWDTCELKTWLTDTFAAGAFAEDERARIAEVTLLTMDEVKSFLPDSGDRICFPTKYAVEQGTWDAREHGFPRFGCSWLTRSLGRAPRNIAGVYYGGKISEYGWNVDNGSLGVRPAIRIAL